MKIETQRFLDRRVGVPLCRLLSLWDRLTPDRPPSTPPRRILVILLSEMGSLVLAVPMLRRLREDFPGAEIHLLIFERNRDIASLLGSFVPVEIHTIRDASGAGFLSDCIRVLYRLRRLGIDAVIDCELFARISSILAYLCGARIRAGFHRFTQEGLYRGDFINRPVLYNPYRHMSVQFLHLAAALHAGSGRPPVKNVRIPDALEAPQLPVSGSETAELRRRLAADFPEVAVERLVLLYPSGGLLPIRAWPEENFRELARRLCADGFTVGIVGPPADHDLAARVLRDCPASKSLNLAGYTPGIRDLVLLFHLAGLLVTNDGGPAHFASLTPMPVLVLFGPETPVLYRPLGARVSVLYRRPACSPCLTAYNHRRSPCDGNNVCLQDISVDEVYQRALELIRSSRPDPAAGIDLGEREKQQEDRNEKRVEHP